MPKTNASEADLLLAPLCRRYLLAILEDTSVPMDKGTHVCKEVVCWGLGTLPDGQLELLGVWHKATNDESLSEQVSEDLERRGVEEVRFVSCLEFAGLERAKQALFLGTQALPSSSLLSQQIGSELRVKDREAVSEFLVSLYSASTAELAEAAIAKLAAGPVGVKYPELVKGWRLTIRQLLPFYDLTPRIRRVVRSADATAWQLSRAVRRAIDRHGCFLSSAAARSFVAQTLVRVQGQLSAFAASPVPPSRSRAPGVSARPDASAAGH